MIDPETGCLLLDLDGITIGPELAFKEFADSCAGRQQFTSGQRNHDSDNLHNFGIEDIYIEDQHHSLAGQFLNGVLFRWTIVRLEKCGGIAPVEFLQHMESAFKVEERQNLLSTPSLKDIRPDADCRSMLINVFGDSGEATGIWRRPWGLTAIHLVGFQFHVVYHPEWMNDFTDHWL